MGKKLVQINTVCGGSTGQIMHDIQLAAENAGYDTVSFVGRGKVYGDLECERFGGGLSFWSHVAVSTAFDRQGYGSYFATKKLIRRLGEEKPDIIHLHNLHGYYLNIPLLFKYLEAEFRGGLFWTFHDCWPFTGHCPYFVMAGCGRWKTGCYRCAQKSLYPVSFFLDASARNYEDKKRMFTSVSNLTVITPSEWMRGLAGESFFKGFNIEVVNNGIDTNIFSPCADKDKMWQVLIKYNIPANKKILLGVASVWENRKGLDTFISLSAATGHDYVVVLAGLSKRQLHSMPHGIIGTGRIEDKSELAALYSLAHVFINPSVEESFSLVTAEAMACGTPVIALDTSAVRELVADGCGVVLHENSVEGYLDAIRAIEMKRLPREAVAKKAERYGKDYMAKNVLALYEAF